MILYIIRNSEGHTFLENATKDDAIKFFKAYNTDTFKVGAFGIKKAFLGWIDAQTFINNPNFFISKDMKAV